LGSLNLSKKEEEKVPAKKRENTQGRLWAQEHGQKKGSSEDLSMAPHKAFSPGEKGGVHSLMSKGANHDTEKKGKRNCGGGGGIRKPFRKKVVGGKKRYWREKEVASGIESNNTLLKSLQGGEIGKKGTG